MPNWQYHGIISLVNDRPGHWPDLSRQTLACPLNTVPTTHWNSALLLTTPPGPLLGRLPGSCHPLKSAFYLPRIHWIDVDTTVDTTASSPRVIGFAVVYGQSAVDYKIVAAVTDGLLVYCLASGPDAGMFSDTVPSWSSRTRFTDAAGYRRYSPGGVT